MKNVIAIVFIALLAISCSQKSWEKLETGVVIYPTNPKEKAAKAILVSPVDDEIIKVSASATKTFADEVSLITVPDLKTVPFEVAEENGKLVVSTAKTKVEVSLESGEVDFLDADGNMILQGKKDGGTMLSPVTVDNVNAYEMQQSFESSEDEAIYGLGQHQADEMNYRGKNEELFQYNTKVSIPFIMSTKNYGLLWDNYSLSRYGDPRPYGQMDQFKLFNADGEEGGLTATYVDDTQKDHVFTVRNENTIDYENLETVTNFPEGFSFDRAKITWEGKIQPKESGLFHFLLYYAGYTKIWVDGVLYADKWRTAWNPSVAKFQIDMKEGQSYDIKLEWFPDGGISYIGLKALSPRPADVQDDISFYSEMGNQINYYFMKGESMDDVISRYRTVTGKAQVMPKWAMGFWQSRER